MTIHRVLGIDPGARCGFALLDDGERIASGVWDLHVQRHESQGMRFVRFEKQLREIVENGVDLVAFEEVARHAGTQAAHMYGALVGVIELTVNKKSLPYVGIPVGTVKKRATGKGNADKLLMIGAAREHWGVLPEDDNEADALWIALCGWEQNRTEVLAEVSK